MASNGMQDAVYEEQAARAIEKRAQARRADELAALDARKLAEYVLLSAYDFEREFLFHDYGKGQRSNELRRRRIELGDAPALYNVELDDADPAELAAAFQRIGVPRIERIEYRETYRRSTPSSTRTVRAWRTIERRVNRRVA